MRKTFDPYSFLAHARLHCLFGSTPDDREPDQADLDAGNILLDIRKLLAEDCIIRTNWMED